MKKILLVFASRKQAFKRFKWMVSVLESTEYLTRVSESEMIIETTNIQYRFVTQLNVESLRGLSCDRIIVDEMASLSDSENTTLNLLLRYKK
jgi:hypothetical protein